MRPAIVSVLLALAGLGMGYLLGVYLGVPDLVTKILASAGAAAALAVSVVVPIWQDRQEEARAVRDRDQRRLETKVEANQKWHATHLDRIAHVAYVELQSASLPTDLFSVQTEELPLRISKGGDTNCPDEKVDAVWCWDLVRPHLEATPNLAAAWGNYVSRSLKHARSRTAALESLYATLDTLIHEKFGADMVVSEPTHPSPPPRAYFPGPIVDLVLDEYRGRGRPWNLTAGFSERHRVSRGQYHVIWSTSPKDSDVTAVEAIIRGLVANTLIRDKVLRADSDETIYRQARESSTQALKTAAEGIEGSETVPGECIECRRHQPLTLPDTR